MSEQPLDKEPCKTWTSSHEDPRCMAAPSGIVSVLPGHQTISWQLNGGWMRFQSPATHVWNLPSSWSKHSTKIDTVGILFWNMANCLIVKSWSHPRLIGRRWSFLNKAEADNCPRENKNNSTLKFLCWILLQKGFEITGILFGRVGHTHGSLGSLAAMNDMCLLFAVTFTGTTELNQSAHWDQIYGVLSRSMRYIDILADEEDLVQSPECMKFKAISASKSFARVAKESGRWSMWLRSWTCESGWTLQKLW